MRIKDILAERNTDVVTIRRESPVTDAARVMTENQIGVVVVVESDEKIVGILSERDISAAVGEYDKPMKSVSADELMTRSVVTCRSDDSVIHAVIKLHNLGIRHLVVMDDLTMVGVVSVRDILQAFSRMIVEKRILSEPSFATELASALLAA